MAMQDAGWNVYAANPFIRHYMNAAPRIVTGWVAVSLLRERRGYPASTLGQWLADGYTMSFGLAPAEWDEMATWEPTSCDGAFLWNPANLDLLALMRLIVSQSRQPSIPRPFIPNSPQERLECPSGEPVTLTNLIYSKASGNVAYTLVSGTLTNLCAYTIKAGVSLKIESDTNSGNNSGPSGIVLGPGESYRFTDQSTDRVHGRIRSLVGSVQTADCPERIC
jgi:hypothetical protein